MGTSFNNSARPGPHFFRGKGLIELGRRSKWFFHVCALKTLLRERLEALSTGLWIIQVDHRDYSWWDVMSFIGNGSGLAVLMRRAQTTISSCHINFIPPHLVRDIRPIERNVEIQIEDLLCYDKITVLPKPIFLRSNIAEEFKERQQSSVTNLLSKINSTNSHELWVPTQTETAIYTRVNPRIQPHT